MKPQLYRLREAIKAGLIDAGIWAEGEILIDHQSDFWNDVAKAMAGARNRAVLVIGVAEGTATEEDGLEIDLTIAVTILAKAVLAPKMIPEEVLWEKTVKAMHGAVPEYEGVSDHCTYKLRHQGFRDAPELAEEHREVFQRARQSTFKVRFSLEPDN